VPTGNVNGDDSTIRIQVLQYVAKGLPCQQMDGDASPEKASSTRTSNFCHLPLDSSLSSTAVHRPTHVNVGRRVAKHT